MLRVTLAFWASPPQSGAARHQQARLGWPSLRPCYRAALKTEPAASMFWSHIALGVSRANRSLQRTVVMDHDPW